MSFRRFSTSLTKRFSFDAVASVLPHPKKAAKGGEDSYFLHRFAVGVADGVGGWADVGVDPAHFARALTRGAEQAARNGERDSFRLMEAASRAADGVQGSSTLCIVSLVDAELHSSNIGDSGFLVIRDDQILFRSEEQQHSFNFPFQLASSRKYGDPVGSAQRLKLGVMRDDLVIVATDGLFDNVFDKTILEMAQKARTTSLQTLADALARLANANGMNDNFVSPFAKKIASRGGKLDDVTVVIAKVCITLFETTSIQAFCSGRRRSFTDARVREREVSRRCSVMDRVRYFILKYWTKETISTLDSCGCEINNNRVLPDRKQRPTTARTRWTKSTATENNNQYQ